MAAAPSPAPVDPALVDDNGTVFRPGCHRANPDGSPFRGRYGQFMPKGGRRKAGGAPESSPAPSPAPVDLPKADFSDVEKILAEGIPAADAPVNAPVEVVDPISLEASWDATLRGFYGVADGICRGRGEWQPEDKAEHVGLRETWVACARAYGWKPLPPILAAVGGSLAFVWKRLTSPNTSRTLVKWFPGLAPWLGVEVEKKPEQAAADKVEASKPAIVESRPVSTRAESYFGS